MRLSLRKREAATSREREISLFRKVAQHRLNGLVEAVGGAAARAQRGLVEGLHARGLRPAEERGAQSREHAEFLGAGRVALRRGPPRRVARRGRRLYHKTRETTTDTTLRLLTEKYERSSQTLFLPLSLAAAATAARETETDRLNRDFAS